MQTHLCSPTLADYQWRLVRNVEKVIQDNHLWKRPNIRILDAGCDRSGKQLWHLANLTRGKIIGINVENAFPSPEAVRLVAEKPNASLRKMDALNLEFPDESFDMVISANVMEHVREPRRYIQECGRVLKTTGTAYFESGPLWTSARGHHLHEGMIHEHCSATEPYRNDGSIIPDWSHLIYDEAQMRSCLESQLSPGTVDWIAKYLYRGDDINKKAWREIRSAFESVFKIIALQIQQETKTNTRLKPHDAFEDYDVASFELVARKAPHPRLTRLLLGAQAACRRRLRLVGLAVGRRSGRSKKA